MPAKRVLAAQLLLMGLIIGGLLWYVGINSLAIVLTRINFSYLLLAFLAYFLINVLFTIRLIRVLQKQGIKASFGRTLLAHYAGMLSSDFTPGRSGYMLTPVYLKNQDIQTSASLSAILGIQSVEFLVKVLGGALAIVFLVEQVNLGRSLLVFTAIGLGIMLFGGFVLAAIIWSPVGAKLFEKVASSKYLVRFTGGMIGKVEELRENATKIRSAVPEIALLAIASWIVKGFEWYFLGLALGISKIGWLSFFLIHPLVTALGFVPLTPSGIGFQEGAIVGILLLLGIDAKVALAFAVLSRVLLIVEDLIGVPQIAKSTQHGLFATAQIVTRARD